MVGGYLLRQKPETDGRSVSLQLTDNGRDALARDPFEVLMRGVAALDIQQRAAVHALQQVLTAVAASGSHWRLPGLLLHRRRHLLQLNKHAFIGPRMPAARRSNAA